MNWVQAIVETIEREGACARVVILATEGPTPRAVGASMLVWTRGQSGKIGRGPIEVAACEHARDLLTAFMAEGVAQPRWLRSCLSLPTGDVLGESTGGSVHLLIELFGRAEASVLKSFAEQSPGALISRPLASGFAPKPDLEQLGLPARVAAGHALSLEKTGSGQVLVERMAPAKAVFQVYGSGLVARALVKCLAELPFDVRWLDRQPGHFPREVPAGVTHAVHDDLAQAARGAPRPALHAVMTADHDVDLAVCKAILEAGDFIYLGVIGSKLKRDRIEAQLLASGISSAVSARLHCPIGLSSIKSKVPAVIAVSIAAEALSALPGA